MSLLGIDTKKLQAQADYAQAMEEYIAKVVEAIAAKLGADISGITKPTPPQD